jgi:hypothetical protein
VAVGAQTRRLIEASASRPKVARISRRARERISANDSRPSRGRSIAFRTNRLSTAEIVAVNEDGLPSFNLLQNFGGGEHTILFYAFDLLMLAGTDLPSRPLEQGRALLREYLRRSNRTAAN